MTREGVRPVAPPVPEDLGRRYEQLGYWGNLSLADFVLRQAEGRRGEVAVVGSRAQTYGELAAEVGGLAGALEELGVKAGDVVGVQIHNVVELPAILLGLVRLGAVPIPMVPSLGWREVRHALRVGEAVALVVDGSIQRGEALARVRRGRDEVPSLATVAVIHPRGWLLGDEVDLLELAARAKPVHARPSTSRPADVALLLMSGGTTGLPKLIPRTHRDYVYNIRAASQVAEVGPATVYLPALPATHNFGLACPGVMGVLSQGGRVVLTPYTTASAVLPLLERERVTMATSVPATALGWCEAVRAGRRRPRDLEVLELGAARLHVTQARTIAETFGCRLLQTYGMSEGFMSFTRSDDPLELVVNTQGRPVSPGDEYRIVDAEGRELPPGELGELLVRGPYTVRGYHQDPEASRASFTPEGFYRTGDLVRQHPSGSLVVEGRAGDVINRGGEKVSAAELEAALIQHAGTAAVAVVGARHATLGERVCACVVPRAAVSVGLADLRRFLREQGFAAYKLPERLLVLGELPLTPFGKVDRKSLRERVAGTEVTRNPTAVTQAGSLEVGRDGRYDAPAS